MILNPYGQGFLKIINYQFIQGNKINNFFIKINWTTTVHSFLSILKTKLFGNWKFLINNYIISKSQRKIKNESSKVNLWGQNAYTELNLEKQAIGM